MAHQILFQTRFQFAKNQIPYHRKPMLTGAYTYMYSSGPMYPWNTVYPGGNSTEGYLNRKMLQFVS